MQRFVKGQTTGDPPRHVRALLERPPAVAEYGWADAALDHFATDPGLEWVPILDSESNPVAVAGRPLIPGGEPRLGGVDRLEPDLTLAQAARRAIDRPVAERLMPFLRCDSRGRYVAIIRVECIVSELAAARERRESGSFDPRRNPPAA